MTVVLVLALALAYKPWLWRICPHGKNLVVHNIPPIPRSLERRVMRDAGGYHPVLLGWRPGHRDLLVKERILGVAQARVLHSPFARVAPLTFSPDNVSYASFSPRRGDYLLFSRDQNGDEIFQKYGMSVRTGKITQFTYGKTPVTSGKWSHAGIFYAYGQGTPDHKGVVIHIMSHTMGMWNDTPMVTCRGGGWWVEDWAPGDRWLLLREHISDRESHLWRMDAQSGNLTLIVGRQDGLISSYGGAKVSKDGRGIYILSDRDTDFNRLVYLDIATKRETPLFGNAPWDITDWDCSPDEKTIAYVANEARQGVLHIVERETMKPLPTPNLPVGVVIEITWREDDREIAFSLRTARTMDDIYSWDVRRHVLTQWTRSQAFGTKTTPPADVELIHWPTFDSQTLSGYLYRPPARFSGRRPVIIDIHGGPESQARPGYIGGMNYFVNQRGIVVISPNIRGSSGYGKRFQEMDNGIAREGAYRDIGTLLDWIKTRPDLDSSRVLIKGASYGGHMALVAAYRYGDRIHATIDEDGMSDLSTFEASLPADKRAERRTEYGDERDPKIHEFMERTAPLNHAAEIKKPLFVVAGENDPRCLWSSPGQ